MQTETITAPPEQGSPTEIGSQEAAPSTQVPAQSQPESGVAPVESNVNQPQTVETPRSKPSDFYRERQKIRNLEDTIRSQSRTMEEMKAILQELKNPKPDVSAVTKLTAEELLTDPDKVFQSREQRLRQEFNTLRQEIDGLKNERVNEAKSRDEREALEMLFPKSSADADEPLDQRIENMERKELLDKILTSNPALDRLMRIDPKAGAELVLLKLSQIQPSQSPKVISKSLMGSTARGSPSGGGKGQATAESLMADLKKLSDEAVKNPVLRFDDAHKKRREQLTRDVERLMKEKRG